MKKIKVLDKKFLISIKSIEIQKAISDIANKMNSDLKGKEVIFVCILNGAFMFASDLLKKIKFNCQISFLKLASYEGTSSSGNVKKLIGINEGTNDNYRNKTIVIIEDIVDSGITIESIINQLSEYQPEEIKIATLLFKPNAYKQNFEIDYVGIKIPNDFIIGFGLDYNGFGRNLNQIYTLTE